MLLESFRLYLTHERRYSTHTIAAYQRDLTQLDAHIMDTWERSIFSETDVQLINHKHLRAWMAVLLEQGLAARTVARKLSTAKTYFRFLEKQGLLPNNPATRVKLPKVEKKLPVFLKENEVSYLLDKIPFPDTFNGSRDRCMLEMLYACGLRRSELINLRTLDVDIQSQSIRVIGKGNKERLVPFGRILNKAIAQYRAAAENAGLRLEDHFFVRENGEKLYPKLVYRIVKKYLMMSSGNATNSPHVLRHTFATHMLDHGADLNAIKELLGHSSLASTQVYTHNTISKLKAIHKQAHPKSEKP
ncbi:MAG: tyrosine-type recombinase/integrase [Bacteroidota bacterium]